MPTTLGKSLNLCFAQIRRPPTSPSPDVDDLIRPIPSATAAATSTSSSAMMIKNFNSLYDDQYFDSTTATSSSFLSTISDSDTDSAAVDFATAFASRRFFFSSPGRSNSIVDQSSTAVTSSSSAFSPPAAAADNPKQLFIDHSVAVPTFSPDPYRDFRRSMQEMVDARERLTAEDAAVKKKSNWEFLHELLLCYLALNPKSTHKFIIGAFADLLVSLMPMPGGGEVMKELPEFAAGVYEISRCV